MNKYIMMSFVGLGLVVGSLSTLLAMPQLMVTAIGLGLIVGGTFSAIHAQAKGDS